MYRGKVYNGDGGSRRSESRDNAARASTNTTKNDRLFERFVRLIGVAQIREAVMSAARAAGAVGKICLIYKIFSAYGYGVIPHMYINFCNSSRIERRSSSGDEAGERFGWCGPSGYDRRNQFWYIARRDDKAAAKTIDRFGRHRSLYAARCRSLSAIAAERKREIHPTLMKVTAAFASTNDDFR